MIHSIIISKISGVSLYQKNYIGTKNNTRLLGLLLTAIIEFGQQTTGMVVEFIELSKINLALCIHEQSKIFCAVYINSNYSKKLAKLICQEILTSFLQEFNGNINDNIKHIGNNNNMNHTHQDHSTSMKLPSTANGTLYNGQNQSQQSHQSQQSYQSHQSYQSNQSHHSQSQSQLSNNSNSNALSTLVEGNRQSAVEEASSDSNSFDLIIQDDDSESLSLPQNERNPRRSFNHSYGPLSDDVANQPSKLMATSHTDRETSTSQANMSASQPHASVYDNANTQRKPLPNVHFKDFKHFSLRMPIILHYSVRAILNSLELIPGVKLAVAVRGREIFTSHRYLDFISSNNLPLAQPSESDEDEPLEAYQSKSLGKKDKKEKKKKSNEETFIYNTYLEVEEEEEEDEEEEEEEDEDEEEEDDFEYLNHLNSSLLPPESVLLANLPILFELSHDLLDIKQTHTKKKFYFSSHATAMDSSLKSSHSPPTSPPNSPPNSPPSSPKSTLKQSNSSLPPHSPSSPSSPTSPSSPSSPSSPHKQEFTDKYLYEINRDDIYVKSNEESDQESLTDKAEEFNNLRQSKQAYDNLTPFNGKYIVKDLSQTILLQGFNEVDNEKESLQMWRVSEDYYLLLFYNSAITSGSSTFLQSVEDALEMLEQLSHLLHELRNYS